MNALKCDRCGSYFTPLKTRLALTVQRVYSVSTPPESERRFWDHDLCPRCQDELRDWWVAGRVPRRGKFKYTPSEEEYRSYETKKIIPKIYDQSYTEPVE